MLVQQILKTQNPKCFQITDSEEESLKKIEMIFPIMSEDKLAYFDESLANSSFRKKVMNEYISSDLFLIKFEFK